MCVRFYTTTDYRNTFALSCIPLNEYGCKVHGGTFYPHNDMLGNTRNLHLGILSGANLFICVLSNMPLYKDLKHSDNMWYRESTNEFNKANVYYVLSAAMANAVLILLLNVLTYRS